MEFTFNSLSIVSLNVRGLRDIIFLQEIHSEETDVKFWRTQWGNSIFFSHGSSHSAGSAIMLHKFKGSVLETLCSDEGRWVSVVVKQGNATFIACCVYGYNSHGSNRVMFSQLVDNLKKLHKKYKNAYFILGGDFNECMDDHLDRYPPRLDGRMSNDLIISLCSDLSLTDAWRFFNPSTKDFTWSNKSLSFRSRIDFFLISSSILNYVKDASHITAPLSDHKLIAIKLSDIKDSPRMRGYWKLNNALLKDKKFNDSIINLTKELFTGVIRDYKTNWEFFKYKARYIAVKRSKEIKDIKHKSDSELVNRLNVLLAKDKITEEEDLEIKKLSLEFDRAYLELAKGAYIRSRAKWVEEGEKNTSYFFALEKRNSQRKALLALNIDGVTSNDPREISKFVTKFYSNLYTSNFNYDLCEKFIDIIKPCITIIDREFSQICDTDLSINEIEQALHSMKKGKSPGIDGLSVEFYLHFWEFIKIPLFHMYKECISRGEMTSTMKQGVISLIPKSNKDPLLIDNWRPITLLTLDYKLLASVYAKRLRTGLDHIISESQSGFMKGRHISNNIRLVLDLLDYSNLIQSDGLILFLDFYKAFDSLEHNFIFRTLELFGFGKSFIDIVTMFYRNINSSVIVNFDTSKRFDIHRGVRQGCPISPFLFLLATELLCLRINQNETLLGISIFDRELKIAQLADDTTLFLKDKKQLSNALEMIDQFSSASGLKLNISKCEIISIHDIDESSLEGIPVKNSVKYLGIHITKNPITRHHLNFSDKIIKTKNIFNIWLQRDLSLYGRVLLSKVEGLSRFVYPALSLFINDKAIKGINKIFLDFIWKNKPHKLKREVLSNSRGEGGLDFLDFADTINTFKVN